MAFQLIQFHRVGDGIRLVLLGPNQLMVKAEFNPDPDRISLFEEDRAEERLQRLDPNKTYFRFWRLPPRAEHIHLSLSQLKQLCPTLAIDPVMTKPEPIFETRVSLQQGEDLFRLLPSEAVCPNCVEEKSSRLDLPKIHFTAGYALKFLEHLLEMIHLLNQAGMVYDDLRLANLIIQPSPDELERGLIEWSGSDNLPRLIDFGICQFDLPFEQVQAKQMKNLIGLFTSCRHGMAYLPRINRGDSYDEANWLYEAVYPEERVKIEPILMLFQFIDPDPINSVEALLEIIRPALIDLLSIESNSSNPQVEPIN